MTAKQVGNLAGALSLKTGIDDEVIQSGENMLLTFKNVRNEAGKGNDIFSQSTKTLVDLSAALGTEPRQAAIQLGKALNDPIKGISALTRVGVTFTEGQKKTIKSLVASGKTLDAQKIILKELNSEFGGAAAAQATAGDKAKVAFQNLEETVGTALLPTLDKLSNFFTADVAPAVSKFVGEMQSGKGAGGDFADTLGDVGDAGKAAFKAIEPLVKLAGGAVKTFGNLPGPIKTLAAEVAIAALVFPRLSRSISGVGGSFTNPIARARQFAAEMTYVETRAAHVDKIVGGLKNGAGVIGMAALADGARRAGGPMKELEVIGGATLTGFAVGGPIGAAVVGGGTALFRLGTAGSRAGKKIEAAKPGMASIIGTLDQVTGAATKATTALTLNAITKQGGFAALNKAKAAYGGLAISQRDLVQASLGNVGAQKRVAAALDTATSSLKRSSAGDASKYQSVQDLMKATKDINKIIGTNANQNSKAAAKTREAFRATATQSELLKNDLPKGAKNSARTLRDLSAASQRSAKGVTGLGGAIKNVPAKKHVDIKAPTLEARLQVGALQRMIDLLHGKTVKVQAQVSGQVGANANGTNDWRGGPTWVGERGPEIVNVPRHARIIPNNELRSGTSGGDRWEMVLDDGTTLGGYVRRQADGRVSARSRLNRQTSRASRVRR